MEDFSLLDTAKQFLKNVGAASTLTSQVNYDLPPIQHNLATQYQYDAGPAQQQIGPTQLAAAGQQPQNPLNQYAGAGRGFVNPPMAGAVQPTMEQPVAPVQQPVAPVQQPVAPVQQQAQPSVFDRIIQAESRGQHFDRQGNILTSPRGAMGIAQIMPQTAAQPGFGVRPATPEEIATPEGNRAFGERYYQGLQNYYGGDERRAVAAYNAGAGNVNKAIQRAQAQGGNYEDYLPPETRAYMAKVFGGPSAQAQAQQAQAAVAPTEMPTVETTATMAGSGFRFPGSKTEEQYKILNSGDNKQLMSLATRLDTPDYVVKDALERLYKNMDTEYKIQDVRSKIEGFMAAGDVKGLNKLQAEAEKSKDPTFLTILKAVLLSYVNPAAAAQEWQKVYPRFVSTGVTVGETAYHAKINPLTNEVESAVNATTNQPATKEELTKINANYVPQGKGLKTDVAPGVYEKIDPVTGKTVAQGRLYTEYNPNGSVIRQYVMAGTEKLEFDTTWKPQSISTAAAKMDLSVIADLRKKRGTDVLGALRDFESQSPTPLTDQDRTNFIRLYGGYTPPGQPAGGTYQMGNVPNAPPAGQPAPPAGQPAQAAPQPEPGARVDATGRPVRMPGEGADAYKDRLKQFNEEQDAARQIRTAVAKTRGETAAKEFAAKQDTYFSNVGSIDRSLTAIDQGKHLLGGGQNALAYQANDKLPLKERSTEYNNTVAMERLAASDNLERLSKLIKPLSNADLNYINKYQMSRNSSPEDWRIWLLHYKRAEAAAYNRLVDEITNPSTAPTKVSETPAATAATSSEKKVRVYNPKTGKLE